MPGAGRNVDAALLEAARQGDTAAALAALDRGAYAGAADSRGFTPLMWAAAFGNVKILGSLLAKDADIDAARYDGMTALGLAAAHGYQEIAVALLQSHPLTRFETELRAASQNQSTDIVRLLGGAKKSGESLLAAAAAGDLKRWNRLSPWERRSTTRTRTARRPSFAQPPAGACPAFSFFSGTARRTCTTPSAGGDGR